MRRFKLHVGLIPLLLIACASSPRVTPQLAPGAAALANAEEDRELAPYTIPPPPEWGDRYAHTDLRSDVRFFRIKKLMTDFGWSRMAAVELQSHYRHLTGQGMSRRESWQKAVAEIKAGHMLSGVDLERLRSASFIVVYDLDETLYQAFYKSGGRGPAWRDLAFKSRDHEVYIKLRPGWERAIARVHELGGLVYLFTARSDDVAEAAAAVWSVGDKNIRQRVDGFLSKSHLVLQEKSDGDPIVTPSKDLRIFDESLERVILVDDNPRRVVQHNRQRLIKKFHADPYLEVKNGAASSPAATTLAASFEQTLPMVVSEIEESVGYVRAHPGTSFGRAYAPYTMTGKVALEALLKTGLSDEKARQYLRDNPTYIDEAF
jgi:hypothetical protein